MGGRLHIPTSAIIMWQSNVPLPFDDVGRETWGRIFDTTGAPKVMLGTKWPSIYTGLVRRVWRIWGMREADDVDMKPIGSVGDGL